MKVFSNFDPLTQSTFLSPFLTTRRNVILDFFANCIIFPAYIICFDRLIDLIILVIPFFDGMESILWIIAVLPILGISGSDIHWRLGFKERKRNFAICIALVLTFLWYDPENTIYLFFLTLGITVSEFTFRRLLARRKFRNPYSDKAFYFLAAIFVFLLTFIFLWINIYDLFFVHQAVLKITIYILLSLTILTRTSRNQKGQKEREKVAQ